MMTLLKYDFRRNISSLLAGLAILIVIQIVLASFLPEVESGILAIVTYIGIGVALFVKMIKTYWSNIRAYNRRLVPVSELSHVVSPLLFGTICGLALFAVGVLHFTIYNAAYPGSQVASYIEIINIGISDVATGVLFAWWTATFMAVTIFLSISIGGSFRFKGGPWIGIVSFFILSTLVSWLDNLIFSGRIDPMDVFQVTESDTEISFTSSMFEWSGAVYAHIVFEAVLLALFIAATVYLNSKKVEV
ncbi:hypothetical protein [Paenibacillus xylanilyticus]|uniref:hypothetical protein n=1 Tax=Paenibacillus xylanilyticus TaxID=248903 RepID=UPI00399F644E